MEGGGAGINGLDNPKWEEAADGENSCFGDVDMELVAGLDKDLVGGLESGGVCDFVVFCPIKYAKIYNTTIVIVYPDKV